MKTKKRKFFVQLDCIEIFLVEADSAEEAVELVTQGDEIDPFDIQYSGEALVSEYDQTIQ